ncbi:MAG: ImuA family protein [Planctomycetaceae bacterium]
MGTRPIIAELSERIRAIERTRLRAGPEAELAPTGLPALGRLLNEPGWPRGCFVEWLAEGCGSGSTGLALWASHEAWRDSLLVMIDSRREMHAPAVRHGGVAMDLSKTVFIRPEQPLDALWSLEQALRTRGIGAVVCDVDRLSPQACRRLQLAAEIGGGLGILLRPAQARRQPSFAEYRFLVQPLPCSDEPWRTGSQVKRRWRVELLRARRQFAERSVIVEFRNGSDGLCVASELGSATPAA